MIPPVAVISSSENGDEQPVGIVSGSFLRGQSPTYHPITLNGRNVAVRTCAAHGVPQGSRVVILLGKDNNLLYSHDAKTWSVKQI